ncbi:MAG TPA: response regulator [Paucimonas sp.]|nr:response regulator [Paucimonas sp.]
MPTNDTLDLAIKPRVLIADDSRIVRATLIKHIEGMFDFKEALDGEQAWETLLLDPTIRVVITDLTMPKLDGYGLLQRIRNSKVARIRNIPVIVVSGSDEQEERDRAKAAGANDLITKGIGTAQLLSRLDVLSKLVSSQSEFERGLETLVKGVSEASQLQLSTPESLVMQASTMLANSIRQGKNFVILDVCICMRKEEGNVAPPSDVIAAIGQLLQRTVRQTDCVARTGAAEYTLATGTIQFDAARVFAQRVCGAIANADLAGHPGVTLIASCGMVALSEFGNDTTTMTTSLETLHELARRRAAMGLKHGISGVVGSDEEIALRAGKPLPAARIDSCPGPDLPTLLQWLREGKKKQVLAHVEKYSAELRPLLELLLSNQPKR